MKIIVETLANLKAHPHNYREHLPEQVEHLATSIKQHGIYRYIITANDNTILAGHGIYEALKKLKYETAEILKINIDPESPQALKILTGDNEIALLGEVDDRMLFDLLSEVKTKDAFGLLGTGYNELTLANLLFTTRMQHEVKDISEAASLVGIDDFEAPSKTFKVVINCDTVESQQEVCKILKLKYQDKKNISEEWPNSAK